MEPAVARAHWGISITELDGTSMYAMNDGQYFMPASNTKLFTTATAMALLPIDEHLNTKVIASGHIQPGGIYEGDLRIVGVGDANFSGRPVLYQRYVPGKPVLPRDELRYINELADQIKAAGIASVKGDIVGDDSLFPYDPYPASWAIDDTPWYYGAPITGLMIADNSLDLTIYPGATVSAPATASTNPALPYYTVEMHATTSAKGSETALDIQLPIGSTTIRVYGSIAMDAKPYLQEMSIGDPARYAALALKTALEARGIPVTGTAKPKHTEHYETSFSKTAMEPLPTLAASTAVPEVLAMHSVPRCLPGTGGAPQSICTLAEHTGAPLYEDVVVTNKISQNQHAELFLRQLGLFIAGEGTTAQGARVVRTFLTTKAGIDPQDFVFYDGSGLSGHDLVTPRAATRLLTYATTQPWGARWKASLSVGGEDGSLRGRFPDAPLKDHVFAKTGTLGEARALSGYLDCKSGKTVAFSIMVTTHTPLNSDDMKAMDRIVSAIAAAQ